MKRQGAVSYLKKVPLFADFDRRGLLLIEKIGTVRHIEEGEEIFGEHSAGDRLYIVLSGRVKIFASYRSKKKTLAYLETGEFFGEMSLLDREPRSASSIADSGGELFVIKKRDFRNLLSAHPSLSFRVMETLSRRLRQADREIESLTFGNVMERVAGTLLELAERYGETTATGKRITLPLSHKEIAELTGTGREVVSRILSRLKRLGCITYTSHDLTLTDAEQLKGFVF